MKISTVLFLAITLACIPAVVQSQSRATQALDEVPSSSSGSGAANEASSSEAAPADTSSSGASSNASASGGEGQLITESIAKSKGGEGRPDMPQPKTASGINYMCGGVGSEETRYMKTAARDYNLMLTFAANSGNYVADVKVAIDDARGNPVLQITCDGPILLVDLPKKGTYRVHADASGHVLNRTVQVSAKGHARSAEFTWPPDVVGVESPREYRGLSREETTSSGSSGSRGASGTERGNLNREPASGK